MSLWLKNGRLLILNGSAVDCDYCPCDPPSDSGSSASESTSDCDECYNCIVACGMNIATPFTIYVNGVAATLPVASVDPFQAAGSVDIGCSILDIIVSFDDECNFTISIDGVEKVLAPDDYEFEPDFAATTTISHPTCGTLAVDVYNGGSPRGCSLVCCDPSESGSSSSGSSTGSDDTVQTECCDAGLPVSLPVTLTGDIAATLTATYVSLNTWETGVFSYDGFDWEVSLQCAFGEPPSMYIGIKCVESQEVGSTSELFDCADLDISALIEYTYVSCGGFRSVTVAIGG
jgi:hypothetical protein